MPLILLATFVLVALSSKVVSRLRCLAPRESSVTEEAYCRDSAVWRGLVRLAGGNEAVCGPAVAAVLGACAGCIGHSLADIFYVVPVRLAWPHTAEFSYPVLLPPKGEFTNRVFKLAMLGDFASDSLFFIPLAYMCAQYGLHGDRWRQFARFWACQLLILAAHLHPALMDDRYHHEDFIYWLHCPCGMAFMLTLFASPIALHEGVTALVCPAESRRRAQEKEKAAAEYAMLPATPVGQATSGIADAAAMARGNTASPASSSGASAPALDAAYVFASNAATPRKHTPSQPRRRSWNAGMLRRRSSVADAQPEPEGARRSVAFTTARSRIVRVAGGYYSSDEGEECSSPRKAVPRRPSSFNVDHY